MVKEMMRIFNERVLFFLIAVFVTACGDPFFMDRSYKSSTREAERIIAKEPPYRAVDQICSSLSIPERSTFVGKARLFKSVGIFHYYKTDQNLDTIEKYYKDYFIKSLWETVEVDVISRVIGFKKDNIEIEIQLGGLAGNASYSIGCFYARSDEKHQLSENGVEPEHVKQMFKGIDRICAATVTMKEIIFLLEIISAGCGYVFTSKFDPSRTAEAERIISIDPEYRKMDDLCGTIALPESSTFVGKARMFNSVGIVSFYASENDLDAIESHFRGVLSKKGWEFEPNDLISRVIRFRKGDLRISSTLGGISQDVTFSLRCEKIQRDNGDNSYRLEEQMKSRV